MNKVEVFKKSEEVGCQGPLLIMSNERMPDLRYDPYAIPERNNFTEERYNIRTIAEQRCVSERLREERKEREVNKLLKDGFEEVSDIYRSQYPLTKMFRKVKRYVIADKMIESAIEDVEAHNRNNFIPKSSNQLIITLSKDINKLSHELESKESVIKNYREEYKKLKSISWFDRVFRFKKALKDLN